MTLDVLLVCITNLVIFLALLWCLPQVWGLRSALLGTAKNMNQWSEDAAAALGPTAQEMLKLRHRLQSGQRTLSRIQRQTLLIGTLIGLGRWILKRTRLSP